MIPVLTSDPFGRWQVRDLVKAAIVWTVFVLLATGAWVLLGLGEAAAQEPADVVLDDASLDGELLWNRDCVSCHGPEGNGTDWGPSLQGMGPANVWLVTVTGRMPIGLPAASDSADVPLETLAERDYRAGDLQIMRGEPKYQPGEIAALVDYSRDIITGPDVPVVDIARADLPAGQELFQLNCAACHTWSARGGALYDGKVATSLEFSSPAEVVAAMRVGLGTMPEFSDAVLSDEQAADIAAYVEYLRTPRTPGGRPLAFIGPAAEGFVAWVVGIVALVGTTRWIGTRTHG